MHCFGSLEKSATQIKMPLLRFLTLDLKVTSPSGSVIISVKQFERSMRSLSYTLIES